MAAVLSLSASCTARGAVRMAPTARQVGGMRAVAAPAKRGNAVVAFSGFAAKPAQTLTMKASVNGAWLPKPVDEGKSHACRRFVHLTRSGATLASEVRP